MALRILKKRYALVLLVPVVVIFAGISWGMKTSNFNLLLTGLVKNDLTASMDAHDVAEKIAKLADETNINIVETSVSVAGGSGPDVPGEHLVRVHVLFSTFFVAIPPYNVAETKTSFGIRKLTATTVGSHFAEANSD